jgi:hypothetical protein
MPSTTLVLTSTDVEETVTLELDGLGATVVFDTRECPASCSGGINPVI